MTGPNRTPSQWRKDEGWKYGIDPRVPHWGPTGEAVELPEPEPESERADAAYIGVALVALVAAGLIALVLVWKP